MTPPTPEEAALADELVQQATAHLAGAVPPIVLDAIRANLLDELLVTPEGRRRLRSLARDRSVDASGSVPRQGSAPDKAGTGT
jgi:hypothetical protein